MGKELKECIICGEVKEVNEGSIQCCCNYSMFYKHDLDILRNAGWFKITEKERMDVTKQIDN